MISKAAYYIDIFSRLGEKLVEFGRDATSRNVIKRAEEANCWFSEDDIETSVKALCERMLQRGILEKWLSAYNMPYFFPVTKDIAVVMAGNIPAVGFHDLMCVLACGHSCHVKKSSKDSVLMEYIIMLLKEIDPGINILEFDYSRKYDAVIATGSDNTNRYFRSHFSSTPSLLRGNRSSLAVLSGQERDADLRGLANDIFVHNGLGCRNVSLVFVPENYDIDEFGGAIALWQGKINPKYCNNYMQAKALMTLRGINFADHRYFCMTEERDFPGTISQVNYSVYKNLAEVTEWLEFNDSRIQCVVSACSGHPRQTGFGESHNPYPWDYPDGKDVMKYLLEL